MNEPWCQFCRKDVLDANGKPTGETRFDYNELHAIEVGVGDGLMPWRSDRRAWRLHRGDWHYYILARGLTTVALAAAAAFCAWRCTRGVH